MMSASSPIPTAPTSTASNRPAKETASGLMMELVPAVIGTCAAGVSVVLGNVAVGVLVDRRDAGDVPGLEGDERDGQVMSHAQVGVTPEVG